MIPASVTLSFSLPILRLMNWTVRSGSTSMERLASMPTTTLSADSTMTTEGVVWSPSLFFKTTGLPYSSM